MGKERAGGRTTGGEGGSDAGALLFRERERERKDGIAKQVVTFLLLYLVDLPKLSATKVKA